MSSKAWQAFRKNTEDIERLLKLHSQTGGSLPGRRHGLEVLNKSAVVLLCSFWESYCEDIATEGLSHLIEHSKDASALPKELRKIIAKQLKEDLNELKVWELAGDGWRDVLRNRSAALTVARNKKLNSPTSYNINELFLSALGLANISKSWQWQSMSVQAAEKKLNHFVTIRGDIAHRGTANSSVLKATVDDFYEFIKSIGSKTGGAVNGHVKTVTGKPLWQKQVAI